MKKTPVIVLNFKKYRALLIIPVFFFVVILTFAVSLNIAPIKLSSIVQENILRAGFSLSSESSFVLSIFPGINIGQPSPKEVKQIGAPDKTSSASLLSEKEESPSPFRTPENKGVSITNNTNYKVDQSAATETTPEFLSEDFSVLILHTHTTESYTPTKKNSYTPSDTDRTLDENYNVIKIGGLIKDILSKNNIKVYHDKTLNDYPSYNGSYNRSLSRAEKYLKNDSSIKIILDVHRDAIIGNDGEKIKYLSEVDGEKTASIMLVVGSNESGLSHSDWKKNMDFALSLQNHIQKLYPGLMRPVNLRKQRFNQHLAPGALIVEVGTNANTLEEALLGAEYFTKALVSYLNS